MVTQCPGLSRAQRTPKRDWAVQHFARAIWVPAVLMLGACGSVDTDTFRMPDMSVVAPRTRATLRETQVKPVTAEDLVDTEGRCAGVPTGPDPNIPEDRQQENVPMIPSAIALDMTECDVVKRAGHPGRVEFGTNDRGDRSVTLTYLQGARPGIYRFTAGRLTSIERAPEPPAPAKPPRRQQQRRTAS